MLKKKKRFRIRVNFYRPSHCFCYIAEVSITLHNSNLKWASIWCQSVFVVFAITELPDKLRRRLEMTTDGASSKCDNNCEKRAVRSRTFVLITGITGRKRNARCYLRRRFRAETILPFRVVASRRTIANKTKTSVEAIIATRGNRAKMARILPRLAFVSNLRRF